MLAAIAIPVIIHFLTRLRLNKVEFSSLHFIKKLETSSIRKVQIQKILLLLLRILAISALVLMLAQPVTQGLIPGWLAAEQRSHLVIVIDNSASMNGKLDGESLLESAKSGAISLLPFFHDNTQATVIQTCPKKTIFTGSPHDPLLPSLIKGIEASYEFDNIWDLIDSLTTDPTIDELLKECVVFSSLMHRPDSTFLAKNFLDDWKFYFINPGQIFDNISIQSVSSINRIKTVNDLVKLNTRIRNSGNLSKPNVPVELLFDNHRVGQVVAEFVPAREKEFIFQAYPGRKGIVRARVTLPDDDYSADNNWFISMPVMEQIKCGLIASTEEELTILEMIFRSIDPTNQFLFIESRLQPEINRLFIDELDVVVIHNPQTILEEAALALDHFLKNGGGLIWFQGNGDTTIFNSNLVTHMGFPVIEEFKKTVTGFFGINYQTSNSDLLSNLQVRNIHKELPEIFSYIDIKTTLKQKIHLTLDTGDPFLLEFSKGSGTVFYFTSLLDLRWNDLPVRGLLIPLIYRLLILSGTDEINTSPVTVGSSKWISIEQDYIRRTWEVESPSGQKTLIVPDFNREGILIPNTDELGIYQVFSNGELFTSFPTRLHEKEYIRDESFQVNLNQIISADNTQWLSLEMDLAKLFSEVRQGKALWKTFLLITVVLLLLESIIGRPNLSKIKSPENYD
tara:strand:- start:532 stop:2571 length:2040 start_codon:yes stop_codon:yes gene_type:complete